MTAGTDVKWSSDALVERLFGSVLGAMDVMTVYVGDKLGLYEAIGDDGVDRDTLAARAGIHWRYAGEWLENQVVNGLLTVDDPSDAEDVRVYRLPPGHAEVLLDGDSLAYMTAFVRLVASSAMSLPALLEAYRSGGGVSWAEFGDDMRTGQADMNRPFFLRLIGSEWFPAVPDLHERLLAGGRVADIACGEGWSSIAIARSYPDSTVDGYDIDAPSIEQARLHAQEAGVADRVRFHHGDVGELDDVGTYDLVIGFEFVHDLPEPVGVLSTMRRLAGADGDVIVMDERVGEEFAGQMDDIERIFYGFSMFVCLPDSMSHQPSVATGTVIRPATMEAYAREAGFDGIEILPIENDLWRFYRLRR